MANRSRAETVEYVAKLVKSNPDMSYADIVKEARKAGHHVYPLIMGLAKKALGIGQPRRSARRGRPGRPKGRPGRRPGRPAGMARRGRPAGGVTGDLVRSIERLHSDSAAMRSALHEIARLASKF